MLDTADRGLSLRHCFQQACLRFGRCPVDFVCKDNLMHDSALAVLEFTGFHIKNLGSHDIGRERIGRKLNPSEVTLHGFRKGGSERGFADAGDSLQQDMPAGKKTDQHILNDFFFSDEVFTDMLFQLVDHGLFLLIPFVFSRNAFPIL